MATGRRHDHDTVEDQTAKAIARRLGYGDGWCTRDVPVYSANARDADGRLLRNRHEALRVTYQGETLEQAGRALPADESEWSEQLQALPPEKRAELAEWSATHPLQERRSQIGEHERWRKAPVIAMPRAARFENAALALSRKISRLTRIEEDMLRVFALQDWRAAERVIGWAHDRGHHPDVAANALHYQILFPHARRLHHSAKERAKQLHMREVLYSDLEQEAAALLRRLLHEASVKFWDAFTRKEPRKQFPSTSRKM